MKTSEQLVIHDKFNGTLKFGPNVLSVVATLARLYPGMADKLAAVHTGEGTPAEKSMAVHKILLDSVVSSCGIT